MEPWDYTINKNTDFIVYHGYTACGRKGIEAKLVDDPDLLQSSKIILTTYGMMSTRKGLVPFPMKIANKYIDRPKGMSRKEWDEKEKSDWSSAKDSRLWMVKYHRIIYDEAHHMRNPKSRKFAGAIIVQDPTRIAGNSSGFKTDEQYIADVAKNDDDKQGCSICRDPLGHRLKKTKCGHIYHASCIDRWINGNHSNCPMCRKQLKFHPIEEEKGEPSHSIKWYVTGTPIQNYQRDLRTLFSLLSIRGGGASLKVLAKTYLIRRTKVEVGLLTNIELQPKTIEVKPTCEIEKALAQLIHSKLSFSMQKIADCNSLEELNRLVGLLEGESVFPLFIAARQCAVFPQLIVNKIKFRARLLEQFRGGDRVKLEKTLNEIKVKSAKMTAVIEMIEACKNDGRKIIFAHYRKEIDEYQKLLIEKKFKVGILDGRSKRSERKDILADKVKLDVLIVQIKSGCEGLNLQKYSQVYFTSPSWNPAVDDQAIARAHRIGQLNDVQVFKFVYSGISDDDDSVTLDQYCTAIQNKKRELADFILN